MTAQDIQNSIGRTRIIMELDKNRVRRQAKLAALELAEIDLMATLQATK